MMQENQQIYQVRLGGLGGQGVITGCRILGDALSMDGYNVLQTQSYGIEARGGASCGEVLYGRGEINSLRVKTPDIFLAMSESALEAYQTTVKPGGFIFYDSYLVKASVEAAEHRVFGAPFTEIALTEMGKDLYANLIALGFINTIAKVVSAEHLEMALAEQIRSNQENNLKALRRGYQEAEKV